MSISKSKAWPFDPTCPARKLSHSLYDPCPYRTVTGSALPCPALALAASSTLCTLSEQPACGSVRQRAAACGSQLQKLQASGHLAWCSPPEYYVGVRLGHDCALVWPCSFHSGSRGKSPLNGELRQYGPSRP